MSTRQSSVYIWTIVQMIRQRMHHEEHIYAICPWFRHSWSFWVGTIGGFRIGRPGDASGLRFSHRPFAGATSYGWVTTKQSGMRQLVVCVCVCIRPSVTYCNELQYRRALVWEAYHISHLSNYKRSGHWSTPVLALIMNYIPNRRGWGTWRWQPGGIKPHQRK